MGAGSCLRIISIKDLDPLGPRGFSLARLPELKGLSLSFQSHHILGDSPLSRNIVVIPHSDSQFTMSATATSKATGQTAESAPKHRACDECRMLGNYPLTVGNDSDSQLP